MSGAEMTHVPGRIRGAGRAVLLLSAAGTLHWSQLDMGA
jgi:hypothetical protein